MQCTQGTNLTFENVYRDHIVGFGISMAYLDKSACPPTVNIHVSTLTSILNMLSHWPTLTRISYVTHIAFTVPSSCSTHYCILHTVSPLVVMHPPGINYEDGIILYR